MLKIGIVGLPNVGKSTLFNSLIGAKQADAQNYPFCTIEPNVGVVEVPDERLSQLSAVSKSKKTVPTAIEFVDIAGLVKGAAEGEGLGNKFLSHIREVDAIVQVLRVFEDNNVTHVHNKVDPLDDMEVINLELVMADWQTVSRRLEKVRAKAKGAALKELEEELILLEGLFGHLEKGKPASSYSFTKEQEGYIHDLFLLTLKPVMYVLNCDEDQVGKRVEELVNMPENAHVVKVCAKLEAQLVDLSREESAKLLAEMGIMQSGLDAMIRDGYDLLQLVTYFTSGEPETRGWTVKKNTAAPLAAGVIHTDFDKGYIKADVTNWQDFVDSGGWSGVRESGKLRLEGRDYIVQDGDVCYFHVAT